LGPLTAYLFPGQGSQYVGMGRALYDGSPSAREVFAQADRILGFSLSELCFEGPVDEQNATVNTQPAILATSVAALRALEGMNVPLPSFVAGHSMGEFSALVCAGALSFAHALKLVRERGRLMQRAGERHPGRMAAVIGLGHDQVEDTCQVAKTRSGQYVGIANDNCPGQIVISGASQAVTVAADLARGAGAKRVVPLAVSIAAHTPLMAEAASDFAALLDAAEFRAPAIPFVANATARPVKSLDELRRALREQLTSPVLWADSIRYMIDKGITDVVEVGPGTVLSGLARRIDRSIGRGNAEQLLGL
jgi:[acyl-carrier-protein] S-malonyltransferase